MIRRKLSALTVALFAVMTLVISSAVPLASAASTSTAGSGMRVSPVTTNVTGNPGETTVVKVSVQNVTSATTTYSVIINDFTSTDKETGEPAILLDADKYAPSHSLKRFVEPIGDVTLKPNEEKTISVNIDIPKNAPGGGYFGAVRFAPADETGKNNVTLAASVASLILIRVSGDVKDDLRLASLDVRQGDSPKVVVFNNKNLTGVVRFDNKGNVQEQPFGKVSVKKGDKEIFSAEINNTDPRGNVLPGSIRRFTVDLKNIGSFGKYTLVGNFGYGSNGQLISGQQTFYVIPMFLILLVVLLILLIIFLIFGMPRLIKKYNQGVLNKARRR